MSNDTYIYFVSEEIDHRLQGRLAVKIGRTKDPKRRLGDLQTGCARKLSLTLAIGPMSGAKAKSTEKYLHRVFAPDCLRNEWFTDRVLRRLRKLQRESPAVIGGERR
jgi:hypothetical protein